MDEACPSALDEVDNGDGTNGWDVEGLMDASLLSELVAGDVEAGLDSTTTTMATANGGEDVQVSAGAVDLSSYSRHPKSPYTTDGFTEHRLGDDSCYRRLMKELVRYTRSSMSPYNPNRHVPTDEELQHHARWIMFDEYV
jgi:hypothetical protein